MEHNAKPGLETIGSETLHAQKQLVLWSETATQSVAGHIHLFHSFNVSHICYFSTFLIFLPFSLDFHTSNQFLASRTKNARWSESKSEKEHRIDLIYHYSPAFLILRLFFRNWVSDCVFRGQINEFSATTAPSIHARAFMNESAGAFGIRTACVIVVERFLTAIVSVVVVERGNVWNRPYWRLLGINHHFNYFFSRIDSGSHFNQFFSFRSADKFFD